MPEGPEIRRAADRISKVLIGKEIIESKFYYERIKDKEEIVKNKNRMKNYQNFVNIPTHKSQHSWVLSLDYLPKNFVNQK